GQAVPASRCRNRDTAGEITDIPHFRPIVWAVVFGEKVLITRANVDGCARAIEREYGVSQRTEVVGCARVGLSVSLLGGTKSLIDEMVDIECPICIARWYPEVNEPQFMGIVN